MALWNLWPQRECVFRNDESDKWKMQSPLIPYLSFKEKWMWWNIPGLLDHYKQRQEMLEIKQMLKDFWGGQAGIQFFGSVIRLI